MRGIWAGRVAALLGALALLAGLSACGGPRHRADPTWVPQQPVQPVPLPTPVPEGGATASSQPGEPSQSGRPGSTSSTPSNQDPAVVASRLNAPTGVAVLPDGSALVAERTTGRILQVQPTPGKPVRLVRTITGLDIAGGGGLLDIALSPSYSEDRLILALVTTRADTRVVHFTATGPVTAILTRIPRGTSDNVGRLLVLSDGSVLVGTGDAGRAANAGKPTSLAGKILRVDELGRAASGNPSAGSAVYTGGHRTVNGLCADPTDNAVYETEDGLAGELNRILPGRYYGWPSGDGTGPVAQVPGAPGVGSCAVTNGSVFVASLGGTALLRATIDATGTLSAFSPMIKAKYGRLLTVVAAPDGSLWITTSNRDGHGRPVPADERVLHITPVGGGGNSPA